MEHARAPEDLSRLFVELANAGDAEGLAALYESEAVVAYPAERPAAGREAILAMYRGMMAQRPRMLPEDSLPTWRSGDLALTSSRRRDGRGIRVQVARQQADGTWLRVIDWPEPPA